ncbi:DNA mismatch repair protein Mlh3-like [Copidosoma floridanum]|uniref:DNA mismatch repair protein Mlh3-like n=1 Tax=Copidosoma floridanum TaxID=29053 RepID=UPI0006C9520A|nr:DNA mismatch repair protein Mlh3-like [Copidosoma floridanum]
MLVNIIKLKFFVFSGYRDKKSYRFFAKKLRGDLLISDMNSESLQILAQHRKLLINVGIHLTSIVNSTSCTVDRVPKCFLKKVKSYNHELNFDRLIKNVRQLLLEIANGIAESKCTILPMLPIAINNIIASEACHGAIKFGDPLNVEECTTLIKALQDTKAPTRCAHGRPSIVPLIDLTDLGNLKPPVKVCFLFFVSI